MRNRNKSAKIFAAISMAAAATLAPTSARAVTLTLYYGQDPSYANSNNNIEVSTGTINFNTKTQTADAQGEKQLFSPANVQTLTVSQTAPTTIVLPVGAYLSLALDAVLTGNIDPDGGQPNGYGQTYGSFLGLAELSTGISSSDSNAQFLTPISKFTSVFGTFNGNPTYSGTANIQQLMSQNGGGGATPNWNSLYLAGDVQPNVAGADAGHASGNVGLTAFNTGGTVSVNSSTPSGIAAVQEFAAPAAAYANATDFADSQVFWGISPGAVTLQPFVQQSSTQYWSDVDPFVENGSIRP